MTCGTATRVGWPPEAWKVQPRSSGTAPGGVAAAAAAGAASPRAAVTMRTAWRTGERDLGESGCGGEALEPLRQAIHTAGASGLGACEVIGRTVGGTLHRNL